MFDYLLEPPVVMMVGCIVALVCLLARGRGELG